MRRSIWTANILEAWEGEPCPSCGRPMRAFDVDGDGAVWSFCDPCRKEFWVAHEPIPASFDPEAEWDGGPF